MDGVIMENQELKGIIEALLFATQDPLTASQIKRLLKVEKQAVDPVDQEEVSDQVSAEGVDDESVSSEEVVIEVATESPSEDVEQPASEEFSENSEPIQDSEDSALQQLLAKKEQMESEISAHDIKRILKEMDEECQANPARGYEIFKVGDGYILRSKLQYAPYLRNLQKMPKPRLSAPAMETLSVIAYQQPVTRSRVDEIRGVDSGGVVKTLLDRDLIRIVGKSEEPGRPILYGTTLNFLETFNLNSLSDMPTLKDLEMLDDQILSDSAATSSDESTMEFEESETESEEVSAIVFDEGDDSEALVEDLENSMLAIKDLEKKIFTPEEKPQEGAEPVMNQETQEAN